MKVKDKLHLMNEMENRNQIRIRACAVQPRKRPSDRVKKKTGSNRPRAKKP